MMIIFGLLIGAIVLFAWDRIPFDVTALIILTVLLVSGILTPREGFSGFSNSATITIGAMFILSEGLRKTGALNSVGQYLTSLGKQRYYVALLVMMTAIGIISAFINNTAAVAIFIPVIVGVAHELKVSASKLLMPLSFASMFGGVCTLIGTSTNILVSSIAEDAGLQAFGMFEFTPIGLIFFAVGMVYLFAIGIRMIPTRRQGRDLTSDFEMNAYLTDVILEDHSPNVGKTLAEADLTRELDLEIIRVFKDQEQRNTGNKTDIRLEAGDTLRIRGSINEIKTLIDREDVTLKPPKEWYDIELEQGQSSLIEAVIAPNSSLEGKSISKVGFYERFGAFVLAIRQRGKLQQEHLGERKLSGGDSLLLSMDQSRRREIENDPAFVVASKIDLPEYRTDKIPLALGVLAMVVGLAAFNVMPIVVSATMGVVFMILCNCLTTEEAYNAINWKVIVLLGGVLPLGVAMQKTGIASLVSQLLIDYFGQWGPTVILSAFFFLSMTLTNIISNQATAALLGPVVIEAATNMSISPRPFLVAVTLAASLSFMTPVGYQTNTMIFGPGQYKFSDFMKVGTPLNLVFWAIATVLIPYFWNF